MKKLIILAVLVVIGYGGYKKLVKEAFTEEGFAQIIDKANKDLPRTISKGVILEKMKVEPGLRASQTLILPFPARQFDRSRAPGFTGLACEDTIIRFLLNNGVTLTYIVKDNAGESVVQEVITQSNC
jgi:hypothetical protein